MPVPEPQQNAAAARVDADDPVREAACVGDTVDDGGAPEIGPPVPTVHAMRPLAAETP